MQQTRSLHEVIGKHLLGDEHVGLYPLGDDDTCWWVAADFDRDSAMLDALAYLKAARAQNVPAALEVSQSGRGAHVWIFFAQATSASVARQIATSLLGEAFQLRGSMYLSSYDRLFPSQDVHTGRVMVPPLEDDEEFLQAIGPALVATWRGIKRVGRPVARPRSDKPGEVGIAIAYTPTAPPWWNEYFTDKLKENGFGERMTHSEGNHESITLRCPEDQIANVVA